MAGEDTEKLADETITTVVETSLCGSWWETLEAETPEVRGCERGVDARVESEGSEGVAVSSRSDEPLFFAFDMPRHFRIPHQQQTIKMVTPAAIPAIAPGLSS